MLQVPVEVGLELCAVVRLDYEHSEGGVRLRCVEAKMHPMKASKSKALPGMPIGSTGSIR